MINNNWHPSLLKSKFDNFDFETLNKQNSINIVESNPILEDKKQIEKNDFFINDITKNNAISPDRTDFNFLLPKLETPFNTEQNEILSVLMRINVILENTYDLNKRASDITDEKLGNLVNITTLQSQIIDFTGKLQNKSDLKLMEIMREGVVDKFGTEDYFKIKSGQLFASFYDKFLVKYTKEYNPLSEVVAKKFDVTSTRLQLLPGQLRQYSLTAATILSRYANSPPELISAVLLSNIYETLRYLALDIRAKASGEDVNSLTDIIQNAFKVGFGTILANQLKGFFLSSAIGKLLSPAILTFDILKESGKSIFKFIKGDERRKKVEDQFKNKKSPEIITAEAAQILPQLIEDQNFILRSSLEVQQNSYAILNDLLYELTGKSNTYIETQDKSKRTYIAELGTMLTESELEQYNIDKRKNIRKAVNKSSLISIPILSDIIREKQVDKILDNVDIKNQFKNVYTDIIGSRRNLGQETEINTGSISLTRGASTNPLSKLTDLTDISVEYLDVIATNAIEINSKINSITLPSSTELIENSNIQIIYLNEIRSRLNLISIDPVEKALNKINKNILNSNKLLRKIDSINTIYPNQIITLLTSLQRTSEEDDFYKNANMLINGILTWVRQNDLVEIAKKIKDYFLGNFANSKTLYSDSKDANIDIIKAIENGSIDIKTAINDPIYNLTSSLNNIVRIFGSNRRASGGPVIENQPYIVGEKGPEIFIPNSNGMIISNDNSQLSNLPLVFNNAFQSLNIDFKNSVINLLEKLIKTIFISTKNIVAESINKIKFLADGGPISIGEPTIVGEKGPELIIPKHSGTVFSTSDTLNILDRTKELKILEEIRDEINLLRTESPISLKTALNSSNLSKIAVENHRIDTLQEKLAAIRNKNLIQSDSSEVLVNISQEKEKEKEEEKEEKKPSLFKSILTKLLTIGGVALLIGSSTFIFSKIKKFIDDTIGLENISKYIPQPIKDALESEFFKSFKYGLIGSGIGSAIGGFPVGTIVGGIIGQSFGTALHGIQEILKETDDKVTFNNVLPIIGQILEEKELTLAGGSLIGYNAGKRFGIRGKLTGLIVGGLLGSALTSITNIFNKNLGEGLTFSSFGNILSDLITSEDVMSGIGSIAGAIAGAKIGASVGAVGGPMGMLIGTIVGGLLGVIISNITNFISGIDWKEFNEKIKEKIRSIFNKERDYAFDQFTPDSASDYEPNLAFNKAKRESPDRPVSSIIDLGHGKYSIKYKGTNKPIVIDERQRSEYVPEDYNEQVKQLSRFSLWHINQLGGTANGTNIHNLVYDKETNEYYVKGKFHGTEFIWKVDSTSDSYPYLSALYGSIEGQGNKQRVFRYNGEEFETAPLLRKTILSSNFENDERHIRVLNEIKRKYNENSTIQPREFGGEVTPNQWYLVGENGPELFKTASKMHLIGQQGPELISSPVSGDIFPLSKLIESDSLSTIAFSNSNLFTSSDRSNKSLSLLNSENTVLASVNTPSISQSDLIFSEKKNVAEVESHFLKRIENNAPIKVLKLNENLYKIIFDDKTQLNVVKSKMPFLFNKIKTFYEKILSGEILDKPISVIDNKSIRETASDIKEQGGELLEKGKDAIADIFSNMDELFKTITEQAKKAKDYLNSEDFNAALSTTTQGIGSLINGLATGAKEIDSIYQNLVFDTSGTRPTTRAELGGVRDIGGKVEKDKGYIVGIPEIFISDNLTEMSPVGFSGGVEIFNPSTSGTIFPVLSTMPDRIILDPNVPYDFGSDYETRKTTSPATILNKVKTTAQPYVETVSNQTSDLFNRVKTTTQPYVESAITTAQPYVDSAITTAQPYVETVSNQTSDLFNRVKSGIQPYATSAITTAQPYVETVSNQTSDLFNRVKSTTQPYIDSAITTAQPYVESAITTAQPYVETVSNQTSDLFNRVKTGIQPYINSDISTIELSPTSIGNATQASVDYITPIISEVPNTSEMLINSIFPSIFGAVNTANRTITGQESDIIDSNALTLHLSEQTHDTLSELTTLLNEKLKYAPDNAQTLTQNIANLVDTSIERMPELSRRGLETAISGVERFPEIVRDKYSTLKDKASDLHAASIVQIGKFYTKKIENEILAKIKNNVHITHIIPQYVNVFFIRFMDDSSYIVKESEMPMAFNKIKIIYEKNEIMYKSSQSSSPISQKEIDDITEKQKQLTDGISPIDLLVKAFSNISSVLSDYAKQATDFLKSGQFSDLVASGTKAISDMFGSLGEMSDELYDFANNLVFDTSGGPVRQRMLADKINAARIEDWPSRNLAGVSTDYPTQLDTNNTTQAQANKLKSISGPAPMADLNDTNVSKTRDRLGVSKEEYDIFRRTVAHIESRGRYNIAGGSSGKYDGAYQMGNAAKIDAARALGIPVPSREEFRSNPELQEKMFDAYTAQNHASLMRNSPEYRLMSPQQQMEVLGYAHNQGAGGAAKYLRTGKAEADGFGTIATKYSNAISANLGEYNRQRSGEIAPISDTQQLGREIAGTPSGPIDSSLINKNTGLIDSSARIPDTMRDMPIKLESGAVTTIGALGVTTFGELQSKGGQAFAGGHNDPATTYATSKILADLRADPQFQNVRLTAQNDNWHRNNTPNSEHNKGYKVDIASGIGKNVEHYTAMQAKTSETLINMGLEPGKDFKIIGPSDPKHHDHLDIKYTTTGRKKISEQFARTYGTPVNPQIEAITQSQLDENMPVTGLDYPPSIPKTDNPLADPNLSSTDFDFDALSRDLERGPLFASVGGDGISDVARLADPQQMITGLDTPKTETERRYLQDQIDAKKLAENPPVTWSQSDHDDFIQNELKIPDDNVVRRNIDELKAERERLQTLLAEKEAEREELQLMARRDELLRLKAEREAAQNKKPETGLDTPKTETERRYLQDQIDAKKLAENPPVRSGLSNEEYDNFINNELRIPDIIGRDKNKEVTSIADTLIPPRIQGPSSPISPISSTSSKTSDLALPTNATPRLQSMPNDIKSRSPIFPKSSEFGIFGSISNSIGNGINSIFGSIGSIFNSTSNQIIGNLTNNATGIFNASPLQSVITSEVQKLIPNLGNKIGDIFGSKEIGSIVGSSIRQLTSNLESGISSSLNSVLSNIQSSIGGLINNISSSIGGMLNGVFSGAGGGLLEKGKGLLGGLFGGVKKLLGNLGGGLFGNLIGKGKDLLSGLFGGGKGLLGGLFNSAKGLLGNLGSGFGIFGEAAKYLTNDIGKLFGGNSVGGGLLNTIGSGIKNTGGGLLNTIGSGFGIFGEAGKYLTNDIFGANSKKNIYPNLSSINVDKLHDELKHNIKPPSENDIVLNPPQTQYNVEDLTRNVIDEKISLQRATSPILSSALPQSSDSISSNSSENSRNSKANEITDTKLRHHNPSSVSGASSLLATDNSSTPADPLGDSIAGKLFDLITPGIFQSLKNQVIESRQHNFIENLSL